MENSKSIIITGAPGSGKTSIMKVLAKKGYRYLEEPARSIINEQRSIGGEGVYDENPRLFIDLMLSRSIHQFLTKTSNNEIVFFDRGIPDLLAYAACFDLNPGPENKAADIYRYHDIVFFAPCWEAIFTNDEDRKLTFEQAVEFGEDLKLAYKQKGYQLIELPLSSPEERMKFILSKLAI